MFDFANVLQKFIDVDFRAQPQYVMGDLGRHPETLGTMRAYEDVFPTMIHPRSQWKQLSAEAKEKKTQLANLIRWILNQRNEGSCVGNMETQMHHVLQAGQFGKGNVIPLSASSAYQLIGSSPGSGANVSDAMRKGCDVGIIPLDTPENRAKFGGIVMPATGFYTKRPAGWQPVAMDFRFDECFVIRTLEGLVSAQYNGHRVVAHVAHRAENQQQHERYRRLLQGVVE